MTGLPAKFTWGVATSAFQIEGTSDGDGRGEGIWDRFQKRPGAIRDGDTAHRACDHLTRWPDDIALLKQLGVDAYRLSLSWPRLLPTGSGQLNGRGVAFYDRLLDGLLEAGIAPWVTLYHWDLPQALQDRGGWQTRDIADWLADFAEVVHRLYGDRLAAMLVLNEACMTSHRGHLWGTDAPGIADEQAFLQAIHHQNLAQGAALVRLRASGANYPLGTSVLLQPTLPASDRPEDRDAATLLDATWNRAVIDPLLLGRYPPLLERRLAALIRPGDLELIRQPIDFLGVNYYVRSVVAHDPDMPLNIRRTRGAATADKSPFGMEIYPQGLLDVLRDLRANYGNPRTFVTEFGFADTDDMPLDDLIADGGRVRYLEAMLSTVEAAIAEGSDVHGVFPWSLLDNFEWEFGFWPRFGMVHVDYETMARTPKHSFHWYASRILAYRQKFGSEVA